MISRLILNDFAANLNILKSQDINKRENYQKMHEVFVISLKRREGSARRWLAANCYIPYI